MSSDQARELQERGIQAAKTGQKDQARKLLQQALRIDPYNETSWIWLASVGNNKRERLLCLQKVLEINRDNEMAIKAITAMGVDPDELVPRGPTVEESLIDEDEDADEAGIPIPSLDALESARELALQITEKHLELPTLEDIVWEHKTKRRAGEREIVILRLQVWSAVITFAVILLGAAYYAVSTSPAVQLALFGATDTPRPPTATSTSTPSPLPDYGETATPTATTIEGQPTITATPSPLPIISPWAQDRGQPPATEPYLPERIDQVDQRAIDALANGQAEDVLGDLESSIERQGVDITSPNPYYYLALSLIQLKRYDEALEVLTALENDLDSLERLPEEKADLYRPWVNLAFAELALQQAYDAVESEGAFNTHVNEARSRAEDAKNDNTQLGRAYVILAETYQIEGQYGDAVEILDETDGINALASDESVLFEKAFSLMQQGISTKDSDPINAHSHFVDALYNLDLILYINPYNELAHQLRIETALAMDDTALAVIYSRRNYGVIFSDKATSSRYLGDSYMAENNVARAIEAYSEGVTKEGSDEEIAAVYAQRARLYMQEKRPDLALADFNDAIDLNDLLEYRADRMLVAYRFGDYEAANTDAELLIDQDIISNSEIYLVQARILIDENLDDDLIGQVSQSERTELNSALGLLLNVLPSEIAQERVSYISEYQARAHYGLGNYGDALNAIQTSLNVAESGSRHYIRALTYEEQGQENLAVADYEWLLTWNEVYQYPFIDVVKERIETVYEERAQATANAVATTVRETAQAEGTADSMTATAAYPETATAEAIQSATAAVQATETAESANATGTAIGPVTPTPEPEETEEATEVVEATPETTAEAELAEDPTPTREGG